MKNKARTHKRLFSLVAAVLVAALLLGGSYAAFIQKQHASNELSGSGIEHAGHLIEDFETPDDWDTENPPVKKEISVKNMGGTEQFPGKYGDIYVRVMLKEYMEIAPMVYTYSKNRYVIDRNGSFFRLDPAVLLNTNVYDLDDTATKTALQAALAAYCANPANWANANLVDDSLTSDFRPLAADFELVKGYHDDQYYFYLKSKAKDPNGQYGKFLTLSGSLNSALAKSLVPGVDRATDADYTTGSTTHNNGECLYTTHKWDVNAPETCINAFHDYIQWILGSSAQVLDDWNPADASGHWVLDTATGWAYWSKPLHPTEETALLMEKVKLISQPDGAFYYVIHADMEQTEKASIWNDTPAKIKDTWKDAAASGVLLGSVNTNLLLGAMQSAPDVTVLPAGSDQTVTWASSNNNVVTVNQTTGQITAVGVGTARITATATSGASAYYTVTVTSLDLDLKDYDPNTGFVPRDNEQDPDEGDGFFASLNFLDPAQWVVYHDGSFHLEDIVKSGTIGDKDNWTVEAQDSAYSGKFYIDTDHHGKLSIMYDKYPEIDDWMDAIINHGGDDPTFFTSVRLTRISDGLSAIVPLTLIY
ncbi:MAG: Ig-like domain-containing protein, partial [Oscillospiraceae bacterium]|nr:Ig-like domain-containing protein [Oscillospiraceae bacterium]